MKILIDHSVPFYLAHGGLQTQIEETRLALQRAGVGAEFSRWWDDGQQVDLIHYFAPANLTHLYQAGIKGVPVVLTTLLPAMCNLPGARLFVKAVTNGILRRSPVFRGALGQMHWNSFHAARMNIVGLEAERRVLLGVYGIPPARVRTVPLGLPETFLHAPASARSDPHLLCVGTITARKRCVELARLALAARVPVVFLGKPYSEDDAFWKRFRELIDGRFVIHRPHVSGVADMLDCYSRARGFVSYAIIENWCLAAHEACACGLPLLLPDANWAHERFGAEAAYFTRREKDNVERLRTFYEECPSLGAPRVKLHSWSEVGRTLRGIYEECLDGRGADEVAP